MYVSISKIPQKFNHIKIQRIIENVLQLFLTKKQLRKVEIDIVGKRSLLVKEGAYGYCLPTDDRKTPREFEIELDTGHSEEVFFHTLIHELIHLKQYALGELKDTYKPKYTQLWKGKDMSDVTYSQAPWEKEARYYEKKLAKRFLNNN